MSDEYGAAAQVQPVWAPSPTPTASMREQLLAGMNLNKPATPPGLLASLAQMLEAAHGQLNEIESHLESIHSRASIPYPPEKASDGGIEPAPPPGLGGELRATLYSLNNRLGRLLALATRLNEGL
jgi:hypothetical protein